MMCQPILSASYSSVMYTGGLGTAMIPKVLSNMLCGLQVCAMAEAMLIGEKRERERDFPIFSLFSLFLKFILMLN